MRKTGILSALLALALTACGGADDSFVGGTGSTATSNKVGTLTLITSSPTVPSDGSVPAQISAFVRDSSNKFLKDVQSRLTKDTSPRIKQAVEQAVKATTGGSQ